MNEMNENVNEINNEMNNVEIAGVAQTYKDGKFSDSKSDRLILFKGYKKIKKLKHIDGEEFFKYTAERFGWTVLYDFDWCEKKFEDYSKDSFAFINEENKKAILKKDAKCVESYSEQNVVVWAAYKKISDFFDSEIEACGVFHEDETKKEIANRIKELGKQGKYCWIAFVCGNTYGDGLCGGICDSLDEIMQTDFEMCRKSYLLPSNENWKLNITLDELGWKTICYRDFGPRTFSDSLSYMGSSKCAALQELKRIKNDNVKTWFDKLCSCGWYATNWNGDSRYYCDRIRFEKLLQGGELGILVGEVFKMGSGDDGWKFKIHHADGGVLGGKQIYCGALQGFTGQYDSFGLCDNPCVIEQYNKEGKLKLASGRERFCMSKWNDETKDMCWLTEDETEAWLGLIRGLKMMDKMVAEE